MRSLLEFRVWIGAFVPPSSGRPIESWSHRQTDKVFLLRIGRFCTSWKVWEWWDERVLAALEVCLHLQRLKRKQMKQWNRTKMLSTTFFLKTDKFVFSAWKLDSNWLFYLLVNSFYTINDQRCRHKLTIFYNHILMSRILSCQVHPLKFDKLGNSYEAEQLE